MVWAKHEHIAAHRYAWEQERGPIPEGMFVDHICHQRSCIALSHLRLASVGENNQNRAGAASHNATGVRGVRRMRKKYSGRVRKDGVEYNAGTYVTIDEAAEAVRKLRSELFGEFAGRG
ncbi:HNH endonuclease [Brachybacterium paraconglomeratum]|uniref:HNH endonuclease n=1 Tax=Brachybacterium paraconglomeratum TaxID=173362 RepID=UPI0037C71417